MPQSLKLTAEERERIRRMLVELPVSRDALPYTAAFVELKQRVEDALGRNFSGAQFWRAVSRVAKRGLGGPRKPKVPAPQLSPEEQLEILHLMPQGTGSRDRLPYTPEFDALWRRFKTRTGAKLSRSDFWLALVSAAKKSRKPKVVLDAATSEGLPAEIGLVLRDANPWWQGKPAPRMPSRRRDVFHEVRRRLDRPDGSAIVLRGPEQVGKSTLLAQLIEQWLLIDGVDAARVFRIPLGEIAPPAGGVPPLADLIAWHERAVLSAAPRRATLRTPAYLLLDGIDCVPDWQTQLATLARRPTARVVATSDRRRAETECKSVDVLHVGPLALREIAAFRGQPCWPSPDADLSNWTSKNFWLDTVRQQRRHAKRLAAAMDAYAALGGFPLGHRDCDFTKSELSEHLTRTLVREPVAQAVFAGQEASAALLHDVFSGLCRAAGQPRSRETLAGEVATRLRRDVSQEDVSRGIEFFAWRLLVAPLPATTWTGGEATEAAKFALCDPLLREAWLREPVALSATAWEGATSGHRITAEALLQGLFGYFLTLAGVEVAWLPESESTPGIDLVATVQERRIPILVRLCGDRPAAADQAPLARFVEEADGAADFGLVVTDSARGKLGVRAVAIPPAMLLTVVQAGGEHANLPLFRS